MRIERKRSRISAGEMAYMDEGDGPPVVLLHGFPTSSHLWRDLVPLLAPRFRAIAPDLLGYGESDAPAGIPLDIRAQAGYVRELLAVLGVQRCAVVGHDIGGGVAQLLAFEDDVPSLVLMDSISLDSWPIEGVRMLQGAEDAQVTAEFAEQVARIALELGMGHPDRLAAEDLEEYLRRWRDDPHALVRAARAIDGVGLAGTEERLRGLEASVFVIWGEDDPYQPAEWAERLGDLMPTATVALLPGCSHFVLEDAPETVAPLVFQFLRTRYLGEEAYAAPGAEGLGVSFERPDEPPGLVDE